VTRIPDVDTHHREIWSDAESGHRAERPLVYYVENHNAPIGYAEAALDFEMLVSELLPRISPHELGNWIGPVLHLARQTIELRLKALLETVCDRDETIGERLLGTHDLAALWNTGRDWLLRNGYALGQDARLKATDELVVAFHAVDPSGDLFRFAQSRQSRFGKKKSYDRVGVNYRTFPAAFKQTVGLLHHWEAVIFREQLKAEHGWDKDPYFNGDDFPKLGQPASGEGAA
jgi:hypothetical protein